MRGEILKITLRKHLKSLGVAELSIVSFGFASLVVFLFIKHTEQLVDYSFYFYVFLLIFLGLFLFSTIFLLPAIILHIDYYQRNKNTEYEILPDKMIVRTRRREITYLKSNIEEIYVYIGNLWTFRSADLYGFARIDMKNGESIYLTSLLFPNDAEGIVKKYFVGVPYIRILRFFCTTRGKSRYENEDDKKDDDIDIYGLFKDEGIDEAARHRMKNANWKFDETSKMNKTTCSESKI